MAWWSKRKDGSRIGRAQALAGTLVLLLVVLGPRLGDVVNAAVTGTDGCRILSLMDGDTVWMHCPGSGFQRTRLTGFDTPEMRAECGREFVMAYLAKQTLRWELWRAGEDHGVRAGRGPLRPAPRAGDGGWHAAVAPHDRDGAGARLHAVAFAGDGAGDGVLP
jgi:hypothetical protein